MIEDSVQETMRRMIERARRAERGEAEPIYSLKHMATVTAQNYCKDLRRAERRRVTYRPRSGPAPRAGEDEHLHPLEEVTERTYQESLFLTIAHEVARFPVKQRRALLIDLANRMSFDASPTPLQKAFLREGIQLKAYQQLLPKNAPERKPATPPCSPMPTSASRACQACVPISWRGNDQVTSFRGLPRAR